MVEKRFSTRSRAEPAKKRALTPPVVPPEVEPLPTRLSEGQALPTVNTPQDASSKLQSISQSGVLATSLERSRQKWLSEGIFERYWEKPSKKKPLTATSNPAKETMTRLGPCSLIIEPHVFDITLYSVKNIIKAPVYQPPPPIPSYQAPIYNGPFTGTHNSNGPPPHSSNGPLPQNINGPLPHNNNGSLPQNSTAPLPHNFATPAHNPTAPLPHPSTAPLPAHNRPPPPFNEGFSRFGVKSAPPPPARSTHTPGDPNSDPVIQILATRAAADHSLKSLMKVVASGQASPDQLKEFQNHIDEINTTLKQNTQANTESPAPAASNKQSGVHGPPSALPHEPPNVPIKTEPIYHPYYPPMPPRPPKPLTHAPMKADIHSIVFDFAGGTGDRFLFPRYSMLDYILSGTEVIVSFLLIRRYGDGHVDIPAPTSTGKRPYKKKSVDQSTPSYKKSVEQTSPSYKSPAQMSTPSYKSLVQPSTSSYYKKGKSYYQPITMRLSSSNPRTLEPLARIVAPPDETRRYMEDTFEKMTPAERVFLATRLPHAEGGEETDDGGLGAEKAGGNEAGDDDVKTRYEAPNSLVPI